MTIVVVDASVAAKWFLPEDDSDIAERLLAAAGEIHAPDLMRIEVANTFWKHILGKNVTLADWEFARPRLERCVSRWHASGPLIAEATRMACAAEHPIYDFVYLVLAQRLGAPFVTADRRFLSLAPGGPVVALQNWCP